MVGTVTLRHTIVKYLPPPPPKARVSKEQAGKPLTEAPHGRVASQGVLPFGVSNAVPELSNPRNSYVSFVSAGSPGFTLQPWALDSPALQARFKVDIAVEGQARKEC